MVVKRVTGWMVVKKILLHFLMWLVLLSEDAGACSKAWVCRTQMSFGRVLYLFDSDGVVTERKHWETGRGMICHKAHQLESNWGHCIYTLHVLTISLPGYPRDIKSHWEILCFLIFALITNLLMRFTQPTKLCIWFMFHWLLTFVKVHF